MHSWRSSVVAIVASVILAASQATAQQAAASAKPLLEEAAPGWITINLGHGSGWLGDANDALAVRYGRILVRCGVIEQVGEAETRRLLGQPIRLPDNLDAMRQVAALSGSEILEVSPEVLLLKNKRGICDEPLTVTAQHVSELGIPLDPAIDTHALEVDLFQALGRRVLGWTVFGPSWSGLVYWASHEGRGHELYVLSESTEDLSSRYPTTSLELTKVMVEGAGTKLAIRTLWRASCGGAVAALELDVDHDGVSDQACFSGEEGSFAGNTPLVIVSGATGKRIGEIGGGTEGELVITQTPAGYRFRTRGKVDDLASRVTLPSVRTYSVKDGVIVLDQEQRGKPSELQEGPLLKATAASLDPARFASDEHLVAHYFLWGADQGIPKLGRVGDYEPRRNREGVFPSTVHVLLDYRPQPGDKPADKEP